MRNFLFGVVIGVYGYMTYTTPEPTYDKVIITVKRGETLWEIAGRYRKPSEDIRDVIDRIITVNNLKGKHHIYPGQGLYVPVLEE